MKNKSKTFNIIISGTGGQGLITLGRILSEATLIERKEIKMSELHGLSQRGGSVTVQLRIGKDIYSPLVSQGKANLILVLERSETFKNCYFASKSSKTVFLVNDHFIPSPALQDVRIPESQEIVKKLQGFSEKVIFIEASRVVKEKLGAEVVAGIFIISYAAFNQLLPLNPSSILKAIKKVVPKKYLDINLKAFELARQSFSLKNLGG